MIVVPLHAEPFARLAACTCSNSPGECEQLPATSCTEGGVCTFTPKNKDTACDDGNPLTWGDKCSDSGQCSGTCKWWLTLPRALPTSVASPAACPVMSCHRTCTMCTVPECNCNISRSASPSCHLHCNPQSMVSDQQLPSRDCHVDQSLAARASTPSCDCDSFTFCGISITCGLGPVMVHSLMSRDVP